MPNIGRRIPPPEPDPQLVECAIAKVLDIARSQGITPADFIEMLNSGMPISDFLNAIDVDHAIDFDSAN